MNKSLSGSVEEYRELTLRGMILGALITVIFTASNVYLGLKVGLTFASSIPAAVISMAVLKFFKGSNILENNMVQTQASAAGTLSTIIFVLPGLLMAGYWSGFPFWQTTLLCIAGGILGVIFTIPLRYAMVVKSDLPYPEGVAAAEILKVGGHEEGDDRQGGSGIKELAAGGALAGLMSFCAGGLRVIADSASYWFKSGTAIFQLPMGFSLALLGAGYLVGLTGGIAILLGISIAWGIAVPYFSSHIPQPSDMEMAAFAMKLWKEKVRFIGAGTIGIAAVWTLLMLLKPMVEGMKMSFKSFGGGAPATERAEQDLSPKAMIFWVLSMMFILGVSFYHFIGDSHITGGMAWLLVAVCTLLASVIGFLVAAACGYMAGLVGSSSSPISGVGIVSIVVISLVLLLVGESGGLLADEANRKFLLALTLFCGSAVICVASISNDNLQDLKTGYLLKATPWRQQVALIIGCIVGALVISPVLELLYEAYGFTGIAIGAVLIVVDLVLKKSSGGKLALPVLAVGMGIYLPPSVNMPIVAGAVLAAVLKHIIGKKAENREGRLKNADRIGTLFAAGLIVGESLIGVIMAFIIAFSVTNGGSDAPFALNLQNWDAAASWLGLAFFVTGMFFFAQRVLKAGR